MKRFIFFRSKGFVVLEVWEHEVKKDPDKVLQKILDFIEENK
jgi:very-short-patch-repair endonuclease